ncbi:hypothetical protein [Actinomadura verrucosospora]|uniref:Integral membrane protein n=1 Tax=Actinomadura verrucosospora TaxID=46165 RepID=A0A7D4A7M6_ACTVE|nr:hypothetical protein [Actinomadura verrucosospora]QKG27084.1 Integral membrane protein [Actinomadura verrucosospora]
MTSATTAAVIRAVKRARRPSAATRRMAAARRLAAPAVAAALCAYGAAMWHAGGTAPPRTGTALVDAATTADVNGQVTQAISALFSYNYLDPGRTDTAVRLSLTPAGRSQYTRMFAPTRQAADKQKAILTTTVTHSGVTSLKGGRARVLVYADQRSATSAGGSPSSSGTVILVHAERVKDTWKIGRIDTFT